MSKSYRLIILSLIITLIFTGCSFIRKSGNTANGNNPSQGGASDGEQQGNGTNTSDNKPVDLIQQQIDKMSLEEKLGQMVIAGIDGYTMSQTTKSLVDKYKVGGFIVLGENVKDSSQLLALINSIKQENSRNKIPLFMSVDEEGGRVTRMPKNFNGFPTNKVIGQINNKEFSYKIGNTIGGEIKALGFNMDFAPVLDVNSNPKNPVIGDRSFGAKADIVSSLGVETMKGLEAQNIISVVKHFPGHGDTSVDSHKGLPTVNNDLKRLRSLEFIPFKEAIKNDAEAVMIAHILLPMVDKENPSSMSKTIITDILRNELNFAGVVITDDMTMGAITKNYNIGEAAVKSVKAGADIILVCHDYKNEAAVLDYLIAAVKNGELSEKRINESVYRILKLKDKHEIKDAIINDVDVNSINNNIKELLNSYIKQ